MHGDPTYDEWILDFGVGKVVTSIDDIDPNVCNAIHNINACTAEELEELGIAPTSGSIGISENQDGVEVEGEPEPPFVDSEPVTLQECDLAGGLFWASSDGKVGCDYPEDNGSSEVSGETVPSVEPQLVIPVFVGGAQAPRSIHPVVEDPMSRTELDALGVDCALAGGIMWVSSDGGAGCTLPEDEETGSDSGETVPTVVPRIIVPVAE